MHQYLQKLQHIFHNGNDRTDRTGTGTRSIFGAINMEYDLTTPDGYATIPLLNTKRIHLPSVWHELIWMLRGDTNIRYLKENNVRIWDEWVDKDTAEYRTLTFDERIAKLLPAQAITFKEYVADLNRHVAGVYERHVAMMNKLHNWGVPETELVAGELGPVYGAQWRKWEDTRVIYTPVYEADEASYTARGFKKIGPVGIDHEFEGIVIRRDIDQIERLESRLNTNPDCRRLIVSAWNVGKIDEMKLPPCHTLAQWYVHTGPDGNNLLSCKLYQRSADFVLGIPFNMAFYSTLTHMLASVHGMQAHKFYHSIGDAHIYHNHYEQVAEQLSRMPSGQTPILKINNKDEANFPYGSILDIKYSDLEISNYTPQPAIKAPVAV